MEIFHSCMFLKPKCCSLFNPSLHFTGTPYIPLISIVTFSGLFTVSLRTLACVLMANWELVMRCSMGVACLPFPGVLLCTWHHFSSSVTLSRSHSLLKTSFFTVSIFNIMNKMLALSVLIPKLLRRLFFAFWTFCSIKYKPKPFPFTI